MSHLELERRVATYLKNAREQEADSRKLLSAAQLPEGYPTSTFNDLLSTPLDWRIGISPEGIRFLRDLPYQHVIYQMRGWDHARVVVNVDVERQAAAIRLNAYDQQADVSIEEGALVEVGKLTAFEADMSGPYPYSSHLRDVLKEIDDTNGESGCALDHLTELVDELPDFSKRLFGNAYGKIAATFKADVAEGRLDPDAMPKLSLDWPLLSPYHSAPRK